jgi:rhamnosyltransferase
LTGHAAARTETRIAGIVVAFNPRETQINTLVNKLAKECEAVYVMDNGGGRETITAALQADAAIRVVDMNGNKGLGEALNRGFRLAAAAGFDYVTTFDQDSEPAVGQIASLMRAMHGLASGGSDVAAVGPCIVDMRGRKATAHPFMRRRMGWPTATRCTGDSGCIETDFLITSGSVISMSAYSGVGQYDPGFFVDYSDMEWCFRALSRGYRLFGICSVRMSHELGTGALVRVLGMTILGYAAVRRYYYARNVILMIRQPHVAAGWKARLLMGLIGRVLLLPAAVRLSRGWMSHWSMLIRGIADGITGVRGPYPGQLEI